jgi:O-antigen/teichoic acid export membrane protein
LAHIKQLAGQTAIYGLSSIIGRLLNYLLVPIYTRIFIPEEYGVVTEFYAYVTFLLIIFTYGMETAYFRFSSTSQNSENKIYSTSVFSLLGSSLLFASILAVFSQSIATVIGYPNHSEYIIWFAVILAADAITSIPFGHLRRENKAKRFALVKLLGIGSNVFFNLFFLVLSPYLYNNGYADVIGFVYDPSIGVGYVFISNLLSSLVTLTLLIPEFRKVEFEFDKSLWKEMIVYAFPLVIAGFAGMINETLDRILLKYLLPASANPLAQLGIYGANYKLAIFMTLFIQAFRYAAEPFFFAQAENKDRDKVYADVMNYFILAGSIIYIGIIIYLDIFKYFIGEEYHSGLHIVPVLLLANLFLGIFFNLSIWYKIANKTRWGAMIAIIGAIITVALNIWLIPIMGYTGAAWVTLICYFTMTLLAYLSGQKYYPIKYNVKRGIFYIAIAILIVIAKQIVDHYFDLPEWALIATGTVILLIYAIGGYLLETAKKSVP